MFLVCNEATVKKHKWAPKKNKRIEFDERELLIIKTNEFGKKAIEKEK